MIDLHCHVLPGIDDGPETIEGSVAIARAALAAGTRTIVATPHVSWRYPNGPDVIARGVAEVNDRLVAAGLAIEIVAGAEIAVTRVGDVAEEDLERLALGGGRWLLIEPPFTPAATRFDAILVDLQRRGHRIVLAHPERCPAFHRDPEMLAGLVRSGVLTSITAGSLVGRFGDRARHFALELVQRGMAHNVASDAHDVTGRAPGMTQEIEQAGLGPLADWLTSAVPAAILAGGQEIPARPAVELPDLANTRRSRWRRRR